MHKVLVYARQLLPYSQTFIREQVRSMRTWHPLLVGECLVDNGLPLDGFDICLLHPKREAFSRVIKRHVLRFLGRPDSPVLQRLSGERAALLHVHFGTDAVQVWPLVRALKIPVLVTLHGYDINTYREWWESGRGGIKFVRYPQQLLAMARAPQVHFIAVSQAIRRRAIEFGLPAEKVRVHCIGVDIERFRPGPMPLGLRQPRVLFVGRQVEKKGCELLIRAFVSVQEVVPNAQLVVVGDGPLLQRHKTLATELGVRAEFHGALAAEAVKAEMQRAQVFCLPSITASNGDAEGLPISILEAQACGLPVVITKSGGSDEAILEGETGFCIKSALPLDIASCLERLLLNVFMLESMGANARTFVEDNYNLQHCTEGLERFFLEVVSGSAGVPAGESDLSR